MSSEYDLLMPGLRALLGERVQKMTDEFVKQSVADYELRLRREIAGAAMDVASYYSLEKDQRGITITVKDVRK